MNYLVVVSYFSLFILGFADNLRGPIFPEIIREFQVSDSLGALYFALSSFFAFLASYFIRKKKSTLFLLHNLNIGVLFIGVAFLIQSLSSSFTSLLVGVVFFGISMGLLGVSQNNLVTQGSSPKNRARMLSGLHSMYGFASFLAPLYVSMLPHGQWKKILSQFSFFPVIFFTILAIYIFFQVPKIASSAHKESIDHHPIKLTFSEMKICWVIGFYVIIEIMVGSRLALFMRRYFNYSLAESSAYVTYFYITLLLGRLVVTFFHFKTRTKILLIGSLSSSFLFLVMGIFFHPLWLALSGLTMSLFYPLSLSYISEINGKKSMELISWTMAAQGFFVVMMHLGVGKLTDFMGLKNTFLVSSFCLLISLWLLISLKETSNINTQKDM